MSLSKRLKNMKFMKRKSNSAKRKTKQNDKKAKIEAMQWIQSEAAESNLIIDDRRDEFMMYRTGRRSFGDFNVILFCYPFCRIAISDSGSNTNILILTIIDDDMLDL